MTTLSTILSPLSLKTLASQWLAEDTPSFDYGGYIVGDKDEEAILWMKSTGVLAGCPFVSTVFDELKCEINWTVAEGDYVDTTSGRVKVARVRGAARRLLLGERVALNCLARASGVATHARRLRKLAEAANWKGHLAGTRKTTPGFRLVEKYALHVGAMATHRYDLSSMIMLKDNHIWSVGGITKAVQDARKLAGFSMKIEVECRSLDEAIEAGKAGADIVMLDNFEPSNLHATAKRVKETFPSIILEASGGIQEGNIEKYFGPHVDVISMGSATQGYSTVDFSLKVDKERETSMQHGGEGSQI
ncbi:nicotinate-nucleotide pyrophosphorylase [carboxylating]-like [Oscarella lobularis]|uniref:nicotinate-nucleotide pyrophosphorylase [carboxylating]-like n=1 Tax=Oscarella lobularis TaxID=121494 RepID=UPI003313C0A8